MTKGFYTKYDIRKDGRLKSAKLKERDKRRLPSVLGSIADPDYWRTRASFKEARAIMLYTGGRYKLDVRRYNEAALNLKAAVKTRQQNEDYMSLMLEAPSRSPTLKKPAPKERITSKPRVFAAPYGKPEKRKRKAKKHWCGPGIIGGGEV